MLNVTKRHALGLSVAELAERADTTVDEIECIEEGGTEHAATHHATEAFNIRLMHVFW